MITIGLLGRAGAGKDTVADMAAERWHFARLAMADALRAEVADAWGVDRRLFTSRALKECQLEQLRLGLCREARFVQYAWPLAGFPGLKPRTVMQVWGDWRRSADPDYFVACASIARSRALAAGLDVLVVTDIRFANEVEWVRSYGGHLVRVTRPGLPPVSSHESEWRLDDHPADFVIANDGDLDALRARVFAVFSEILDPHEKEAA
jgi:hypothetical protein